MSKEKLEETISFRLSKSEYQPYKALLKKTGVKKSSLFREVFISKSDKIELPKEASKESKRLLFLASKTANNINQIAKHLNTAYKSGVVTEKVYLETLNNLISVERSFVKAIKQC